MNQNIVVIYECKEKSAALLDELGLLQDKVTSMCFQKNILAGLSRVAVDMIIFHVRVPSKTLLETIKLINYIHPKPVVIFSEEAGQVSIDEVIKAGVSSYIVDGYKLGRMRSILDVAFVRFDEYQNLRQELMSTKEKLNERKLIDKAKGILMQLKNIGEDDAYKMMRKMAMTNNKRIVDIAKNILSISKVVSE